MELENLDQNDEAVEQNQQYIYQQNSSQSEQLYQQKSGKYQQQVQKNKLISKNENQIENNQQQFLQQFKNNNEIEFTDESSENNSNSSSSCSLENEFDMSDNEYDDINRLQQQVINQNKFQRKENKKKNKKKISIDSFHLLSIIGKGSYAKVALVRKKDNGKIYALKILKKSFIQFRDQKNRVLEERKVLEEAENQFVVKMKYAFQNDEKLFFVLEYCPGGELFNIINLADSLNTYQTQFYAAQMVLALEYLHSKNIIYRDLKPENVLIDAQGYIKLTDFGLSKRNINSNDAAKSICGTPEYLAPEILFKEGHGKMVDFWTLGVIIYEMYVGQPPFQITGNQKRESLFEKIKYEPLKYPSKVNGKLKDLLEKLLQKNPSQRLGAKNGFKEVKEHPWFEKFDWQGIQMKKIEAPFKPKLNYETDMKYFPREFLDIPFQSPLEQNMLFGNSESQRQDQQHYSMFTFLRSEENSQYSPIKLSPKEVVIKSQENLNFQNSLASDGNLNLGKNMSQQISDEGEINMVIEGLNQEIEKELQQEQQQALIN
ncbi:Protein kinase-like domain [Pseudocohnilembus persalinus]|uniref:non-specific serine/threonine protein kinase n=1 Tax=Pseudocohnilembus persalinus TaxID=266149 RepID=A0A0V0R002_PSEPJ|nr:Protein kinase-like domain [Pseudocohnilembus persalinus]|eukprot:KRX07626.1 Protein kinase-like domain [Pseudocohnilembus persalinus]